MNAVRRWRPLLRLAWRDAARNKARSALVLFLIALPVLAVTAADVLYQTSTISGSEALDRRLGAADARIEVPGWATSLQQWPDPDRGFIPVEGTTAVTPVTLDTLGQVLGRPLRGLEQRSAEARVLTDGGVSSVAAEELDLRDPLAKGLFTITQGRAPIDEGEVAVSRELASRGPALGETLTVADGPTLRVVGIVASTTAYGDPLLVALPGAVDLPAPEGAGRWLVDAGGPVTWAEVHKLNAIGAVVWSREVLQHPPADFEISDDLRQWAGANGSQNLAIIGLIVVMVLLEVVLLAGPAFAVGARRQSRTLALMSATGGTPAQSRRTILASALVLGSLGAGGGVAAGMATAWVAMPFLQRLSHTYFGPYDVAWTHLAGVVVFGLLSALLAAVVPAWIASRQDVVAVLAGRRGDRKAGMRSPLVGLVLLGAGIAGSAYGAQANGNGELMIAFAAIFAVLGMILLVPLLLVGLSRLSGRLPLALRFAVRDAARHRTRTVPAVAAVAATVAGVVALGIAHSSDAAENRETYSPRLVAGDGVVSSYDAAPQDWVAMNSILERELPNATVVAVQGLPEGMGQSDSSVSLKFQAPSHKNFLYSFGGSYGASVIVADSLPGIAGVSQEERAAADRVLAAGGAAVFANEPIDDTTATVSGRTYDGSGQPDGRLKRRPVDAVYLEVSTSATVPQAVIAPALAEELGIPVQTVGLSVTGAAISADQAKNVDEAIGAVVPYAALYVERGYQGDEATRILLLILGGLGGVLMLGGTLTTTYLALSDARPDLATLSAVGAAPRMRRAVAGSFAVVVALVGGLVGAAVGFIPGIAASYPLTSSGPSYVSEGPSGGFNMDELPVTGPFLDIPWLLIIALVLALPLVTALVVALTTRSRLPLVARLD